MSAGAAPAPSTLPAGLAGTTLAHGLLVVAIVFAAHQAHRPAPTVYSVDLVAAPLPAPAPRHAAREAVPVAPKEAPPRTKPHVTKPKVVPPKPVPPDAKHVDDTPPVTSTPVKPAPGETPSTGQDKATVQQKGMPFPFPEYLARIENAIAANWTRPAGTAAFQTEIGFVIHRDGSVTGLKVLTPSRFMTFDNAAMAAVEAAGNSHAFGPLPNGFAGDELPISFTFTPKKPSQ